MASPTPWLLRIQDPLWRNDHDYKVGAIRTGSDGAMYTAIKENGPNTEAGVKDPTKSPDCWMSLKDSLSIDGPNYLKPEDIGAVSLEGDSVAPAATKLETERTLAGVAFDGTGDIIWYGACSTASGTAAKTVALEGFKLGTGAEVTVKFNNTVTSANPTLNVNNTGAKAIFYNGAAVASGVLRGNRFYRFVYDGTHWNLVGDADADVKQTAVTTNDQFPILFTGTADATGTRVEGTQFGSKITANPSTGTITATKFDGAVEGNADSASKWVTARKITLSGDASGNTSIDGSKDVSLAVTIANMRGATSSAAGADGFVPAPAAGKQGSFLRGDGTWQTPTDNKVAQTVTTTNDDYPLLFTATADATANKTEGARFGTKIKANPSTGTITATTFKGAVSGAATSCTGNAATATKLATARTIRTNLASTSTASFDGSKNVTPGVTGILPIANGGTGNTNGKAADSTKWNGAAKTVSTAAPSGGANGDIWFQYIA